MIYVLLRNDDPCARSNPQKERRVLELFERYQAPQVLAVIPNNVEDPHVWHRGDCLPLESNPAIIGLLKEYNRKGLVEIAQHGYTHQTSRFRPSIQDEVTEEKFYPGIDRRWAAYQPAYHNEYSEFNGLPVEDQRAKIEQGQAYLEKIFDVKLKTFIFPWNTYNRHALKILKARGFQFVPCQDDTEGLGGCYLVGCCHWDWEIYRFREQINEAAQKDRPSLIQFAYHSWDISEETIGKIGDLLQELTNNPLVKFILPHQIPEYTPWLKNIIPLRSAVLRLEQRLKKYLRQEAYSPKYYIDDTVYYVKRIAQLSAVLFILEYLGIQRLGFFLAFMSGLLLPLMLLRRELNLIGWADAVVIGMVVVLGLGYYFVTRRINFKRS